MKLVDRWFGRKWSVYADGHEEGSGVWLATFRHREHAESFIHGPQSKRGFTLADRVRVTAHDYSYEGWCVGLVTKRSGEVRCVVEDANGRLFIHNPAQVKRISETEAKKG